jgi:hypothetical protein
METPQQQQQQLAAEQQQDSNAQALPLFDQLPLGQQNMLLDLASVDQSNYADSQLLSIWRTWHGQQADQWLREVQQAQPGSPPVHGLLVRRCRLLDAIGMSTVPELITDNPNSPHYGSRIWVSDGSFVGGHEVRAWLAALGPSCTRIGSHHVIGTDWFRHLSNRVPGS